MKMSQRWWWESEREKTPSSQSHGKPMIYSFQRDVWKNAGNEKQKDRFSQSNFWHFERNVKHFPHVCVCDVSFRLCVTFPMLILCTSFKSYIFCVFEALNANSLMKWLRCYAAPSYIQWTVWGLEPYFKFISVWIFHKIILQFFIELKK